MGAHYRSIQVRAEERDAILKAVGELIRSPKERFLVGPVINSWVGVYPKHEVPAEKFAASLSTKLEGPVLEFGVHDSDILFYNFFRSGKMVDEYCSCPDYFEDVSPAEHQRLKGKPEVFHELLGSEEKVAQLAGYLHSRDKDAFLFEENRLEKVAELLCIANTLTSYEYLTDGEWDGINGRKQFVHVPDLTAEKDAARAAAAALRAEWRRLKNDGVLCFESKPPAKFTIMPGEAAFDPMRGGVVFKWGIHGRIPNEPALLHVGPHWSDEPQPMEIPESSATPSNLVFSPTGKWFAYSDNCLRLLDWPEKRLVASSNVYSTPIEFSHDEKRLLCQNQQGFGIFSIEAGKIVTEVATGTQMPHFLAWHPNGRYVVMRLRQEQLGLIDLEVGKLIKTLYSGTVCDWSSLGSIFSDKLKQAGLPQEQLNQMAEGFIRGSDQYFNCKFSPDGRLLFCASTRGLRVLEWGKVLMAEKTTPDPVYSASPMPLESPMKPAEQRDYQNFIYDVVHDEQANRLLFCGIEGVIRYFNLNDNTTGVLFKPPGRDYIWRIQLSPNREHICSYCNPPPDERNKKANSIRVWNYRLLRAAAGLE